MSGRRGGGEQANSKSDKKEMKKQNKENKRMSSIAGQINWQWIWRSIRIFILIDVMIYILYGYMEYDWDLFESFGMVRTIFDELWYMYLPIFAVEGLYLTFYLLFGRRGIRRKLRPLYKMAYAAQQLSEKTNGLNVSQFHDLEDAIDKISPNRSDAKLVTGNSDLQGLENAVNNLMDRMHENYQQQSRFVSDASHELRTPISVIKGYVNMLDRWGAEDEKVLNESIEAIKSESKHMEHLVEQLLFLARGDSGKTQLQPSIFSLNRMMKEVYDEYVMIEKDHEFELRVPRDEVYAVADESMIKQSVRILVDNAVKYSPPGESIVLRTGKERDVPYYAVQDSGVGISAEDAPHVFERFYRADSSRTRGTGGTGLGLSIAKWIVDKHGGYFEIVSREGLGSRITVKLPRR